MFDLRRVVAGGPPYLREFLPALTAAFMAVFDHPGPVLAAINGHAIAGGCVLAAACDVRVMSQGTIGLAELSVGVPFPVAALEIMRHAAGPAASRLVLAAELLGPAQAQAIGLIHGIEEPGVLLESVLGQAQRMARDPGRCVRGQQAPVAAAGPGPDRRPPAARTRTSWPPGHRRPPRPLFPATSAGSSTGPASPVSWQPGAPRAMLSSSAAVCAGAASIRSCP